MGTKGNRNGNNDKAGHGQEEIEELVREVYTLRGIRNKKEKEISKSVSR